MFWIFISIIQNKPVIRTITMAFYTYIYAPKQTQLSWVWDNFVVLINSTQIFRDHVISGLSLSLRFVSNHQPRLSFYRLIKVMPKSMKFKGKRSQDKIRHILIFDEEQNVQFTFNVQLKNRMCNFVYEIFMVSWFGESMLPFGARAGNLYTGRTPYNISPGTLQGSARARKGSRQAPLDTVRFPLYLLTKIGKRNRAVPGRLPAGPRAGLLCNPPGFFHGLCTG